MAQFVAEQAILGETSNLSTTVPSPNVLVKLNALFFGNVEKASCSETFENVFERFQTNQERLNFCSQYFPASDILSFFHNDSDYTKNEDISSHLRIRGNEYFQKRNFGLALRSYNLAICYAPVASKSLALAYANRSAVLLELGQMEFLRNCLDDISRAISLGYPEESKVKLEKRKEKAEEKIASIQEIRQEGSTSTMKTKESEIQNFKESVLFQLQNPSSFFPSAENLVELSSHPIRGRELIVNEDVAAGMTLLVEKPFTKILKNSIHWETNHCHNCFKVVFAGIPCNGCVFAMFCSMTCLEEASSKFHRFECSCWPYLHLAQTPRFVLQTLRLISQLGPTGIIRLFKNPNELVTWSEWKSSDVYDPASYLSIYQLVSHANSQNDIEHFSNVIQSLTLVALLEQLTPFFRQLDHDVDLEEFRTFTLSLIMHHLQNLPCNSLALEEVKGQLQNFGRPAKDSESIRTTKLDQYASGVYATISLINHSCDPNVTRLTDSTNGGQMVIVTLKSLKAGEPLFTSYSKSFVDQYEERVKYLRDNYHFECRCPPCTEKWPQLTELLTLNPKFQCDQCCKPIRSNGQCISKCKKKVMQKALLEEFEKQLKFFYASYELVLQNQPLEAIEKLKPVLIYFEKKVIKPSGKYLLALEMLKRAFDLIVYF